jgi:hypothetical protein
VDAAPIEARDEPWLKKKTMLEFRTPRRAIAASMEHASH